MENNTVRVMDLLALEPKFILDSPDELTEEDLVCYIATLKEIARIHGVSIEQTKFSEYIINSLGVSQDIIENADRLITEEAMSMGELVSRIKEPWYRVCLLRDAYIMAMLDDEVDHVEWLALQRLAGTLGLSRRLEKKVMNLVDDMVKIQKDFEKLIEETCR